MFPMGSQSVQHNRVTKQQQEGEEGAQATSGEVCLKEKGVVSIGIDGVSDHLTCLLRNLYVDQEATVRTGHGTTEWFKIGKGVHEGCILSPCLFN